MVADAPETVYCRLLLLELGLPPQVTAVLKMLAAASLSPQSLGRQPIRQQPAAPAGEMDPCHHWQR